MTKIRIIGQISTKQNPGTAPTAEVLYIDSERGLLWAWLSKASDGNKIALKVARRIDYDRRL